jgi:hypothetical protein
LALPAEELSFVPVMASEGDAPSVDSAARPSRVIEVVLGGAVVRVPPEVDSKQLAKVLRAVKSAA